MDWRHLEELPVAGHGVHGEVKNLCVWVKDNAGMGSLSKIRVVRDGNVITAGGVISDIDVGLGRVAEIAGATVARAICSTSSTIRIHPLMLVIPIEHPMMSKRFCPAATRRPERLFVLVSSNQPYCKLAPRWVAKAALMLFEPKRATLGECRPSPHFMSFRLNA
jgi:hypothetical protein